MKSILYIGNALAAHGSNPTGIDTLGALLNQNGFTVITASSKKNKAARLGDMILKTLQYRRKLDYVLIDTYSTQNFWYAVIVSRLCILFKLKYIPILHGGNLPNRLKHNPNLCAQIFNNAYANVTPSRYMMTRMQEFGYTNITVIPNFIDRADYAFKHRIAYKTNILWVRSLDVINNPSMAIKALAIIKQTYPDAQLCMVGPDKGLQAELQQLANNLGVEVTFTGKLAKSQWIKLSENYDIFINTTHTDNTPVSVIEAMALGLCVISTNVGGMPFLIEDKVSGLLVADNDVEAMASTILSVVENNFLAQKLCQNARETVTNFDKDKVLQQWFTLLK